jgi:hypothetical protein
LDCLLDQNNSWALHLILYIRSTLIYLIIMYPITMFHVSSMCCSWRHCKCKRSYYAPNQSTSISKGLFIIISLKNIAKRMRRVLCLNVMRLSLPCTLLAGWPGPQSFLLLVSSSTLPQNERWALAQSPGRADEVGCRHTRCWQR